MIIHYFKIAWRNLVKQKTLAALNIAGLSIGIACFSLFLLYALNEFSFDGFHKNADRIFRVNEIWKQDDGSVSGTVESHFPVGPAMKQDFPDVERFIRFQPGSSKTVRVADETVRLPVDYADPAFFSVFTFPLLYGDPATCLNDPHNIVLTKETALRLFGTANAVGKRLAIESEADSSFDPFVVTAVAQNPPVNSTIQFGLLSSFDYLAATGMGKAAANSWHMVTGMQTYVELRKGSRLMDQPDRLLQFHHKYYPEETAAARKKKKKAVESSFELQSLRAMHTTTGMDAGPDTADPKNIWLLVGIAAGVLLIACINFTTLAIGRSAGRAREVGVRKVIGSRKKQLIFQFLAESLLLTCVSAALGWLLATLLLPLFNQLSGTELVLSFRTFPQLTWMLGLLVLVVGLLAGSYPALLLSGFRPVQVLRSTIRIGGSNIFTKSLVTLQFVISIGLIIITLVVWRQLSYMRSRYLGFNKENVVVVNTDGANVQKVYPLFRQALQSRPSVAGVAASEIGLGDQEGEMGGRVHFPNGQTAGVIQYPVEPGYLKVLGMQLLAGRDFNPAIPSDTADAVIVNEALVQNNLATTPAKAIGMQLTEGRGPNPGGPVKTIIGVIRNFNFEPLNTKVRAQLFYAPSDFRPSRFFVRIHPGNPAPALAAIQATWKKLVPDLPFEYNFLDEKLDNFYKSEARWSRIFAWAGSISIFLACLGLFGLTALVSVNRTKEIGIRKILGASVISVVSLLSKDFLRLVCIALLVAAPLAGYWMDHWLENYAYRIHLGVWIFALTGILALSVALLTTGVQAVRAAISNPVDSLRTE